MRSEWETAAQPGEFDFSHVDNPELKLFLDNAAPQLQPIFTTDFRRTVWHVPFGESVIEMGVDRGSIQSEGRQVPICEVELELISGNMADIFGLTRELQNTLDLRPAVASKAERGYALFAGLPETPFKAKTATLDREMTPVAAFRTIALGCLEHYQRNERGLITSKDPEYVHQARVALRRLRSAIKLFAPVLPPDFVAAYGQTWQTLAGALGDTRNWDVFVAETLPPILAAFPDHRDARRLLREGARRARQARAALTHMVALPDYSRLIVEFTAAIYALQDQLPLDLENLRAAAPQGPRPTGPPPRRAPPGTRTRRTPPHAHLLQEIALCRRVLRPPAPDQAPQALSAGAFPTAGRTRPDQRPRHRPDAARRSPAIPPARPHPRLDRRPPRTAGQRTAGSAGDLAGTAGGVEVVSAELPGEKAKIGLFEALTVTSGIFRQIPRH